MGPAIRTPIILLLLASPLSLAQDVVSETEEVYLEEVIVTGSRIKRRDYTSPSPLTTINHDAFEFSGQPTLEEYLNQMPQLQPDFGRTSNNPGDGRAKLNLRGLGPGRTLVLLNGRRLAPSGVGSAVDVNNLPRSLIERVEIITGGASTVYGSDAIAGVVNFVTRQDFEGLSLDASYSLTEEGDSDIYDVNIAYGHNLASGGGNITFYAGYYERKALFASERELTAVVWSDNWLTGELFEAGSGSIPGARVLAPRADLGSGPVQLTWDPDGTPRAFVGSEDRWNYAPLNYLQTPLTRYSTGLMANFDISRNFEAYVEAAFTRNDARRNLAPAPAFAFATVNTDNPVLTPETRRIFEEQMTIAPGLAGLFISRRMLELGARIMDAERDYTRLVAGIRGEFRDGWDIDAWLTYTKADETESLMNDGSLSRYLQGLLVDPATGQCFDPSGGCVPLDIFGEGRLSAEGVDFIRAQDLVNLTERTQWLASAVVTGSPFEIWSGPVDMAFGVEWREDEGHFEADEALFTGDTMSFRGAAPVDGTERVYELYAEALVPLLDGASGQYLGLELGARYSDYKNAGSVWTWKAGLEWQPMDALRFRAMLQHSVRAPNNEELFTAQFTETGTLFNFGDDPCSASSDPVGNGITDKCVLQGLPPDQVGVFEATEFYPVDFLVGGNPDLLPEDSDALTVGVVITPGAVPDLTLAIDYFDLEVNDTIGEISAVEICFDPLNSGNAFCENIQRDATGNVADVFEPISNRGLLGASGVDVQLQYQRELPASLSLFDGPARFSFNTIWTHMISNESQENVATTIYDCAGYFGWPCAADVGGRSFPSDRLIATFDYVSGPLDIRLTWRWIDGMRNGAPLASANFGFPDPNLAVPRVASWNYFDLGFGYRFSDSVRARFGVNNLLDKEPPNMADAVLSNNTDTGLYDVFGRTYFFSVSLNIL